MAKQIFKLAVECVKLLLIVLVMVLGTVGILNELGFKENEIRPEKPLSAERQSEINELYAQIAADLKEINAE